MEPDPASIDCARLERELRARTEQLEIKNAALAQREAELSLLLQQLPAITWTVDRQLIVTAASGAALRALGMTPESLVGQPVAEVVAQAADPAAIVAVHERAIAGSSQEYVAHFGEVTLHCHVEPLRATSGEIVGAIGVALDVTQSTRLEKQLRHAVRMDALGKLASGIAHDFNNLLTVILSFTEIAAAELDEGHPVRADLEQVTLAADRAAKLVRQLLLFSRQQPSRPEVIEPDRTLRALLPMLGRLLGEDIRIRFESDAPLWPIRIDPSGLEQIILNLAVNSRDAMPGGGEIVVEMRNVAGPVTCDGIELPAGDYVRLCVADQGQGIPVEIRSRIFEPFFTTKDPGRGTGLGLSTVYGIVRDAGGAITCESEVGRGTRFCIVLPRASTAHARRVVQPESPPRGRETILVVEDEEPVRVVAVRALERLGYTVHQGRDAASALAVLDAEHPTIDLLLTDVVLPDARGPELAARARVRRPGTKVLFMSGYADGQAEARTAVPAGATIVDKPLRPDALARAVRAVLDA